MRPSNPFQPRRKLPFSTPEIASYQAATAPVLFSGGDDLGLRVTVRGHGETLPTNAIRFAEQAYAPEVCKTVLLNTPGTLRQDTDPNEFFFQSTKGTLNFDEQEGRLYSTIPTTQCDDGWVYCTSLGPESKQGMNDLRKTFSDRPAYRRVSVLEFAGWIGIDLSRTLSGTSKEPVHVQVHIGIVRYLNQLRRRRYLEGLAGAERLQLAETIFTKTEEYKSEQEVRFWFMPARRPETPSSTQHEDIVVDLSAETLNCIHDDVDALFDLKWKRAEWEREFGFHSQPLRSLAD